MTLLNIACNMQNMQNNMHDMQNMQMLFAICRICTAHFADGAGAGGEPSDAQERLPLFQDVILFRRQQSLTADSLI